jgi:FtsP/CotA-like multicopper oxidase with cupredoxin domain
MEDSSGVKRGPGLQRLDRRGFLKLAGGAVTGGVAGALLSRTGLAAPAANAAGLVAPRGLATLTGLPAVVAGTKHFYLYATDGYLLLPDGTRTYMRGFAGNNPPTSPAPNPPALIGKAQIPAPIIEAVVGDDCYLHLREIGNVNDRAPVDPHTIHLHGIHVSTQNDGFPETSFELMGNEAVYYFKPEHAGTYMYHCHVEASEHVQLGMYGALIVRPATNTNNTVFGGIRIGGELVDRFDREYVMLLSDLDTRWHRNIEVGSHSFNPIEFRPDYWLLNGRSFPDTLLPAHPVGSVNQGGPPPGYDTYVHVTTGERFLLRMINLGYDTVPWHVHGWHFVVVGKDASPLLIQNPMGHLHSEYTVTVGSGETYDLIIEADDKSGVYANKSPQGVHYVDIPKENGGTHRYDGTAATFFPQFYPMHNHDDYKVTNNGIYPGGQLTLIQSDEP